MGRARPLTHNPSPRKGQGKCTYGRLMTIDLCTAAGGAYASKRGARPTVAALYVLACEVIPCWRCGLAIGAAADRAIELSIALGPLARKFCAGKRDRRCHRRLYMKRGALAACGRGDETEDRLLTRAALNRRLECWAWGNFCGICLARFRQHCLP